MDEDEPRAIKRRSWSIFGVALLVFVVFAFFVGFTVWFLLNVGGS